MENRGEQEKEKEQVEEQWRGKNRMMVPFFFFSS